VVSFFFFFFSSLNLSGRRLDVYHTWYGLSANLECRSEMCCTRLAENTGCKKKRYLDTIAQLCRAISSQLTHIPNTDNRKKKLVKQQYLLHMSPHYGELQPTRGGDSFVSLGTPANFNGFRVLAALLHGTPVLGVSQTAALNRGRHLYSTGRPSRWALAHISSYCLH